MISVVVISVVVISVVVISVVVINKVLSAATAASRGEMQVRRRLTG